MTDTVKHFRDGRSYVKDNLHYFSANENWTKEALMGYIDFLELSRKVEHDGREEAETKFRAWNAIDPPSQEELLSLLPIMKKTEDENKEKIITMTAKLQRIVDDEPFFWALLERMAIEEQRKEFAGKLTSTAEEVRKIATKKWIIMNKMISRSAGGMKESAESEDEEAEEHWLSIYSGGPGHGIKIRELAADDGAFYVIKKASIQPFETEEEKEKRKLYEENNMNETLWACPAGYEITKLNDKDFVELEAIALQKAKEDL